MFVPKEYNGGYDVTFESGQRRTRECDMGCASNYVLGTSTEGARYNEALDATLPVASSTPCSADRVIFPPAYSSKVYAEGVYDFNRITVAGVEYSRSADLESIGTHPVMLNPAWGSAKIRVNDVSECEREGYFNRTRSQCMCFDTCSASLDDLNKMSTIARQASEDAIAEQLALDYYDFSLTFALGGTAVAAHVNCLAEYQGQILETLLMFGGVQEANVSVAVDGTNLQLTGTLHGQYGSLHNEQLDLTYNPASRPPSTGYDLSHYLWNKLALWSGNCVGNTCANQYLDELCALPARPDDGPTTEGPTEGKRRCSELAGSLFSISSPHSVAWDNYRKYSTGDVASLRLRPGQGLTEFKEAIRHQQTQASARGLTLFEWIETSDLGNYLSSLETRCASVIQAHVDAQPRTTTTAGSVSGYFGALLSQAHVNRLIDEFNRESLAAHLASGTNGHGRIVHTNAQQIAAALKIVNPNDEDAARDRRAADSDNPFGRASKLLYVELEYEVFGAALSSRERQTLITWIGDLVNSYQLKTHKCFSLQTAWDTACVKAELTKAYSAGCTSLECLKRAAQDIMGCGLAGEKPDGTCYNDLPEGNEAANEVAAAAHADATASSSNMLPIIAAVAAGAVLIIVIIVVVVVKRRNKNGVGAAKPKGNIPERTVVAFENPMYDSPAIESAPTYGGADGPADEGLYDEPAFNAEQKNNPMYQSDEELAQSPAAAGAPADDMHAEEGGGYLDVQPDEGDE